MTKAVCIDRWKAEASETGQADKMARGGGGRVEGSENIGIARPRDEVRKKHCSSLRNSFPSPSEQKEGLDTV